MERYCAVAVAVFAFGTVVGVQAHEPPHPAPSSAELSQVKQLAGKWKGTVINNTQKGKMPDAVVVEYKVTSGGSAVQEILAPGKDGEMIDMYHDEDGKLAMTHYCAMGNRPHMTLKSATPKSLSLEMGPTPGIDAAKDMHMHALTLEFPDADHLVQKWISYANGKPSETVVFKLARVK